MPLLRLPVGEIEEFPDLEAENPFHKNQKWRKRNDAKMQTNQQVNDKKQDLAPSLSSMGLFAPIGDMQSAPGPGQRRRHHASPEPSASLRSMRANMRAR